MQRFSAQGSDGRVYVVVVSESRIPNTNMDDSVRTSLPGLRSLRTSTGDNVNRLEKGKYQIVASGVT